jgi:hypothetical protein
MATRGILKKLRKEKQKERLIDHILNDFSGGEQEQVLRSKRSEMDEDYLERLQNSLQSKSLSKLKQIIAVAKR